jgi:lysozyme
VDRNAFFGSERQFRDWMDGRFDIGTRRMTKLGMTKPEDKTAAPQSPMPARPTQRSSERAPLGLVPPGFLPPGSIPEATSSIRR